MFTETDDLENKIIIYFLLSICLDFTNLQNFFDFKIKSISAYTLKGTNIGISEQFPKEIEDSSKALYPIMKKAKAEGHKTSLIKDKLFINGKDTEESVPVEISP